VIWNIVVPAWGDRCVRCFIEFGLPAIRAALKLAMHPAALHVYTDQPERLATALAGLAYAFFPVPPRQGPHRMLGLVHGHALRNARRGDMLAFLNADHVPSVETFAACEARFAAGKRLIMCAGLRTTSDIGPPIGESSRALLAWNWRNAHIHTRECVWGAGRSDQPAILLFVNGEDVVLHAFHLHPVAVQMDGRDMAFRGHTIDDDLAMFFTRAEIHVVTDADEMALAEISPNDAARWRLYATPLMLRHVAKWAHQRFKNGRPYVNARHLWFFQHAIRIVGHGDANERERVAEILSAVV